MNGITLNKGLEPFDIYFKDIGQHSTIYFNPSDSDLPKRLIECKDIVEKKAKEIKPYEVDENGVPQSDDCLRFLEETNQVVYDAIDYAFGNKISDTVFEHCGAFSVVNGEYQILNFLNAITPEIEKMVKANQKTANRKMDKYLEKYKR